MRVFFLLIQTALLFVFDGGLSIFQLRIMLCLWANSVIKACSVEANPFETFLLLWIAATPLFDYFDKAMRETAQQREL